MARPRRGERIRILRVVGPSFCEHGESSPSRTQRPGVDGPEFISRHVSSNTRRRTSSASGSNPGESSHHRPIQTNRHRPGTVLHIKSISLILVADLQPQPFPCRRQGFARPSRTERRRRLTSRQEPGGVPQRYLARRGAKISAGLSTLGPASRFDGRADIAGLGLAASAVGAGREQSAATAEEEARRRRAEPGAGLAGRPQPAMIDTTTNSADARTVLADADSFRSKDVICPFLRTVRPRDATDPSFPDRHAPSASCQHLQNQGASRRDL